MSDDAYRCDGKDADQIAHDARQMMESMAVTGADGKSAVLTAEALLALLDNVVDGEAFLGPMAEALLSLVFERDATVTLSALRENQRLPSARE